MFKFPLKRHHNNTNQSSSSHQQNKKSASSRSNEGFIFIRCGHNHLNSNPNILNSLNNSSNNLNSNSSSNNISNYNNTNNNNNNNVAYNKKYVAKSTVQSSWRPQLPLPKEIQISNDSINNHQQHHHTLHIQHHHQHRHQQQDDVDIDEIQIIESDMDRFHMSKKDPSLNGSQLSNATSNNNNNSKKWSFGRLFRRGKKEIESESSSEDDRKAGFSPAQKYARTSSATATSTPNNKKSKTKSSGNRSSKQIVGGGFDHIVVSPNSGNSSSTMTSPVVGQHIDNEFFLPVETVSPMGSQEPFYQNHHNSSEQSAQPQRLHHSQQYLPHVPQTQQQLMSKSAHSLDTRSARPKQRSAPKRGNSPLVTGACSSSEEELISLNSSTFSKYRSDESIHSGGQGNLGGTSRRSRAARNERYYKRLSRDGEVSHGQVPIMVAQQPTQRWKTQPVPLSIYQAPSARQNMQQPQPQVRSSADNVQYSKLRNTSSLQHMAPYVQWGQQRQPQQPKVLQNSVNAAKRSISYDSQIHLQNVSGRMQTKPLPPPPPPRDPLRRVNVGGHAQDGSSGDLRPMSYAFDQAGVPVLPTTGLNGRCVSDDKIWAQHQPQYQSIRSLNITSNQVNPGQPQHRRFITRAERDAHPGKKSLPNGLDFHYVAESTPRSRKPIHMLDQTSSPFTDDIEEPSSSGVLRTTKSGLPTSPTKVNATEFWKRMEGSSQNLVTPTPAPRGRDAQNSAVDSGMKPRSVSSSRVGEMRAYPMPMYSEVYKPNKSKPIPQARAGSPHPNQGQDEVDGVVCGSLRIKPAPPDNSNTFVEIRKKDANKSHSMPDHYQRRSGEIPTTPNKYEEYVNERKEQHHNAPQPPQRKLSGVPNIPQLSFPRKKPANLEEAINELEAIYRSLGLTEPEPEVVRRERVPTPNDFEKYALAHADEYDDEDSPTGEPDPIRDDVAFRNIKLANLQHKTVEKQPPFGIPVGPIVPASQTDYLHVMPKQHNDYVTKEVKAPDVIKDDLAVRALRKDPVQQHKERFQYPSGGMLKKNRATRTQSANIYALIQRDAAKPSGGDLYSYLELTKSIDRSGSMSDLQKSSTTSDIPSTLKLLQSLKEQDNEQYQSSKKAHIPFRHPSQGGAICQLPEKLVTAEEKPKPKPMPRKSLTPEPQHGETHKMEEALNKIAQDAQESSIKLTQELQELRKEALITNSKPKRLNSQEEKIEQELQEIEKVSQAAKKCGKMLLDTLPDSKESPVEENSSKKARKLHKEDKLIKAIDQVSEAANKVCEKILKDIVTTEPPVVVQEAVRVQQPQQQQLQEPETKKDTTSALVMPTLIKKLDPIQSDKIEAIARRCMRQLSDLAENNHDYDNLNQPEITVASTCNLEDNTKVVTPNDLSTSNLTETHKTFVTTKPKQVIEDIDQIMRECEDHARKQEMAQNAKAAAAGASQAKMAPGSSATASSFSSSSDCLAKSSSPSASRRFSSSITSFNPYSSSDYIKSPSSDFHAPSTDRIKSCSTTSYDVQSTTSATPNITTTTSNFSCSPSPPPLNLTPVSNCSATLACSPTQRARSSSPSQYNSSEELAMIFGIEEKAKMNRNQKLQKHSGNNKETQNSAKDLRMPEPEMPLTAASPKLLCTANECCSKTNPNECCCLLTLKSSASSSLNTNTTNASSSPQNMSSSASTSSTSRLETIPELGADCVVSGEDEVKLSPNFNRIYASRVNIFVDKSMEGGDHRSHMTQFDSLSSLEETSSNPDSGNVSLADFPLASNNINNSLQLSSTFNSRFEVRNCFKTEISINTEKSNKARKSSSSESGSGASSSCSERVTEEEDVEFPPLPTEEELEQSLKESLPFSTGLKEKKVFGRKEQELFGKRILLATEEIMAEVKALQASVFQRKSLDINSEDNSILDVKNVDLASLENFDEETLVAEERKELLDEIQKLETDSEAEVDQTVLDKTEFLRERVSFACDDSNEVSDPEDFTISEKYTSLQADVCENLGVSILSSPQRKRSIVFETPLLEMNIMEEKINYEININAEQCCGGDLATSKVLSLQELALNCYALQREIKLDESLLMETKVKVLSLQQLALDCYEKALTANEEGALSSGKLQGDNEANGNATTEKESFTKLSLGEPEEKLSTDPKETELRLRLWHPSQHGDDQPTTSTKAASTVNILGERRPDAVNGLTLLEHIVVACALGLINTDDLFTLCLIIIGIIIVIAIALL